MIIVNLLPRVSKVCVCTTDKNRQSVIEELHIDPWESEVRQLCLGESESRSEPTRSAVPLCDTLLTILETKALQSLGTSGLNADCGCDWHGVCHWLNSLQEPVEIILEYNAVVALNSSLPGGDYPTSLLVKRGSVNESVLYDNRDWFESNQQAA